MKSEVRREKSSSDIGKAVKKESGYPKRKIILISSIVSGILLLIVLIIMIILLVSCPGLFFTQHGHVTNRERTSPATQTSTKTAEIKPSSVKWTAPQTDIEDERNEDGSCKYIETRPN